VRLLQTQEQRYHKPCSSHLPERERERAREREKEKEKENQSGILRENKKKGKRDTLPPLYLETKKLHFFIFTFFGQNFRFVLGGLSRCFNCSIPRPRFASYHHTRETLQRVRLCTLLSPQFSLSLSQGQSLLPFVFNSNISLSCLPRARTSSPRRPPDFGVIRSVDSQSHCL
jgi:hypothetical protein